MLLFPIFSRQFLGFPLIATSQCTIYVSYLVVAIARVANMTGNRHDAVEAVRPLPPFKMRCNGSQDCSNAVCCCMARYGKVVL